VALLVMLPVADSNGGEGFRSSGLPKGFEEVNFVHFKQSLMKLWGQVTKRDPAQLASTLALAMSTQQLSRGLRHWVQTQPCLPPDLRPMVNRIDTASALIQLGYDPARGSNIMGVGPLQNFKIVKASWDAKIFEPAYIILQNYIKPRRYWIVVRGTYSVEDILTDIAAEPEKFMDGHVHKGILRSAEFIVREIKECLKETMPNAVKGKKKENAELFFVGHSLGGGAAALATAMLRIENFNAKAVVFGVPSCIHRATYLVNMLERYVTHIVLADDVIPRLNNETLSRLLEPADNAASQLLGAAKSFVFNSFRSAVADNRPLAKILGMDSGVTPMQCPPGRTYLLQANINNAEAVESEKKWDINEVGCEEMGKIILSPRMLKDHNVQSYVDAVQGAFLRYFPVCGAPRNEL